MKRLDFMITEARGISKNEANPDGSFAISNEKFIRAGNDAQKRLQAIIIATKNIERLFASEKIIPLVANQETYSLSDRIYMNRHIDMVEFSSDSTLSNYLKIDRRELFNRDTNTNQYPICYNVRGNRIYVSPIPSASTGSLRVTYQRTLDDINLRRGLITTVNGLTATGFTSIVIDSTADETSSPNLSTIDYISIVDVDGARRAYNIPVGSYVTATNTLTPRAGFTFELTTDTIAANDYVTFGKYTTTHPNSLLPDEVEPFLIHYMAEAILHNDSSKDILRENEKLQELLAAIIKGVSAQTGAVQYIPQQDTYGYFY